MTESAQPGDLPRTQTVLPLAQVSTKPYEAPVIARRNGHQSSDLQVLLRKRLLFLSCLFVAGAAVMVMFPLMHVLVQGGAVPAAEWLHLVVYNCVFLVSAAITGVLWRRPALSLRNLRFVELMEFGTLFAFWSWMHGSVYTDFRVTPNPVWFGFLMANAVSLPWMLMMIAYGILIPNTWRRCAVIVGAMGLAPLVIAKVSGLAAVATEGHSEALFYIVLAVWLGTGAAVAIYGSHRIEVLRQEVVTARQLGQYQLKQRLGAGGMGEVYLAEHKLLRRPCALKLIRADRAADAAALMRFEREVQTTATLTHPNTVQVFDYGRADDGTFYYAMEYLPGLSLQDLAARHGPLPPARAVYLLRQICGALCEAHSVGLIHRDIKPNNILVCERGGSHDVAKLVDFGLVHTSQLGGNDGKLTQEGLVLGTPAYMSTEQASGVANVDARSDIYSLGAVAYFLLTGSTPFKGTSAVQILAAHLYEPVKSLRSTCSDVPADLEAVVLRCMEKEPIKRYADAESLDRALAECACAGAWDAQKAREWWRNCSMDL
jgi:serine/threonine-protein kinase